MYAGTMSLSYKVIDVDSRSHTHQCRVIDLEFADKSVMSLMSSATSM